MDKFFAALMMFVISTLIFSFMTMFESKSNAATIKQGVEVMLKHTNDRQPAIGSNLEGK